MTQRDVASKRLFEVSVLNGARYPSDAKTWLVLADDENDARTVEEVRTEQVVRLIEVPGAITARGPSRTIGWTRAG